MKCIKMKIQRIINDGVVYAGHFFKHISASIGSTYLVWCQDCAIYEFEEITNAVKKKIA